MNGRFAYPPKKAKQGGSFDPPSLRMKVKSDTRVEAPREFTAPHLEHAERVRMTADARITAKLLRDILVESEFLQYLPRDEHRADGAGMYTIPHQIC